MHGKIGALLLLSGVCGLAVACEDLPDTPLAAEAAARRETVGPSHVSNGGPALGLERVASGLTSPVALVSPDDGSGRLFIVDQIGEIRVLSSDGTLLEEPFLDLTGAIAPLMPSYDERGLLGLAFAPDYAESGRFFVYYAAPPRLGGYDNTSTVSEFRVSAGDRNRADPGSEQILLQVDQPQFNHEAGTLAFGPDGYLYVSIGDGGGANDTGLSTAEQWLAGDLSGHVPDWYDGAPRNAGGNGQDVQANLLGNILRLDVSRPGAYAIPPDNPFVGEAGLDEIYAYGFRNPYRFSFDRATGDLYVGDAGQVLWEEIDLVVRGGNYGWNVKEGTHCFDAAENTMIQDSCPDVDAETGDPLIDPIIELAHHDNPYVTAEGIIVIVGGYVYRGSRLPQLDGRYVFGAYGVHHEEPSGEIYVSSARPGGLWHVQRTRLVDRSGHSLERWLLGFGEDAAGELYVLTTENQGPTGHTGEVYRITPPGAR